tara:strand:- start:977 stop:1318 length:342 start_codon:yes stop_codon:yes gene_type:complete
MTKQSNITLLVDLCNSLYYNKALTENEMKNYIELEHIATKIPHVEPLNYKECQLFMEGSDASLSIAYDSIASRMDLKMGIDEGGVFEDYLGNHYFTNNVFIDGTVFGGFVNIS